MKMSQKRYELLKTGFQAAIKHFGRDQLKQFLFDNNQKRLVWGLHTALVNQLQYPDDHPYFKNGVWDRWFPYQENFSVYDDDGTKLHDQHIETAINKIARELELINDNPTTTQ